MPEQVSPRETYRSERIELNLGPHHPSTHGVFRAVVELDVEVPERAQVIRVMMAELSRIFSHLFWLGTHGHDVGAMTPLFYMLREREEIMNLFELTAGGRLMPNYLRIGGIIRDLEDGFVERLRAFTDHFDRRVDEYETLLTKNAIYMDRTQGIGILPLDDAIAMGASGP